MPDDLPCVLVTAANGALGRHISERLSERGVSVVAASRRQAIDCGPTTRSVAVGSINGATDWTSALAGVTHVVHLAALTQLEPDQRDEQFDIVNRDGTRALAKQAAAAGVTRFVHISTAALNGRATHGRPATVEDAPQPFDAYGRSKLAAERALHAIAARTGLQVAIVRPPRIVWPQLTGNLRLFEALIRRGVPLPLGAVRHNARDKVSPDNLAAIVESCLAHPAAAGRTFFATDGEPLSTREMTERIAARIGRTPRLVSLPVPVLRALIAVMPRRLLGHLSRAEMASELLDDFVLDIDSTRSVLGWSPVKGTL